MISSVFVFDPNLFRRVWLFSLPFVFVIFRVIFRRLRETKSKGFTRFFPAEFFSSLETIFPIFRAISEELDCRISTEFGNELSKFPGLISATDQPRCNRNSNVHRITRHHVSRVHRESTRFCRFQSNYTGGQKSRGNLRTALINVVHSRCSFSDICC